MLPKNKTLRVIMYIVIFLMLITALLQFDWIAKPIAGLIGQPIQQVKDIAQTVFLTALAVFLISSGVAAIAVPVIGFSLIIVGLVMLYWGLKPLFTSNTPENTTIKTN